jgi:hypothetical protein
MIANRQQYNLHTDEQRRGAPEFCPITGRQYWGHVTHPELGSVPTYGGPFDTYTIPEVKDDDVLVHRYDQDAAEWSREGFL